MFRGKEQVRSFLEQLLGPAALGDFRLHLLALTFFEFDGQSSKSQVTAVSHQQHGTRHLRTNKGYGLKTFETTHAVCPSKCAPLSATVMHTCQKLEVNKNMLFSVLKNHPRHNRTVCRAFRYVPPRLFASTLLLLVSRSQPRMNIHKMRLRASLLCRLSLSR